MNYCKQRSDLIKQRAYIPIGHIEVLFKATDKIPYRWVYDDKDNESFEVFYMEQWHDAYSIDFEF